MNYNVFLALLYSTSGGVASGIWNLSVLSTYISVLEGSTPQGNERVGFAQAIQGTLLAATAIPAGWLATRMRRDKIIKAAGVVSLAAIACTVFALLRREHKFETLCVAIGLWGVAGGADPVLDALFADSVPTGARSRIYTLRFMLGILSMGLGPAMAAIVFGVQGNTWSLVTMQMVMLCGMVAQLVPAATQFLFDDSKALGSESEGVIARKHSGEHAPRRQSTDLDPLKEPLLGPDQDSAAEGDAASGLDLVPAALAPGPGPAPAPLTGAGQVGPGQHQGQGYVAVTVSATAGGQDVAAANGAQVTAAALAATGATISAAGGGGVTIGTESSPGGAAGGPGPAAHVAHVARYGCVNASWIPPIMAIGDCLKGLASGMTIKYFPIFFKDEVGLPPAGVSTLYAVLPVTLAAASWSSQRVSRHLGRVQTILLYKLTAISMLYWMGCKPSAWSNPAIIIPVYVLRTSLMNSCYPLQKSILMDFAPKAQRAFWNSLDSITLFGWSGSAALGGWLLERRGFNFTFLVTASMQLVATLMMLLLLPLVPRSEAQLATETAAEGGAAATTTATAASTADKDVTVMEGSAGGAGDAVQAPAVAEGQQAPDAV